MRNVTACPHCGGNEIYYRGVSAKTMPEAGLDLLPGIGKWGQDGKFDFYACGSCGHLQIFVADDMVHFISEKWQRVQG